MPPTAIVTGAARGIGLAIARRLALDGFATIATDRDVSALADEVGHQTGQGRTFSAVAMDVTDRVAVCAVLDHAGELHVVVNNAGVAAPMIAFKALTQDELRRVVRVNTSGTFIVAQEAARRMREGGRIINVASRGYLGGAGASHYVASKAAVVGLTRAMAIELRWKGITVNAVAPGMVDTQMITDFTPEQMSALLAREPSGKAASPDAIAGVVSFLASPAAEFINGQVLITDGGKSVGMPTL